MTGSSSVASSYRGHGLASLAPEQLQRFRPEPLPPEISRRIQALLDLGGLGMGGLSPDGKVLRFNWAVTGVPQVWVVDGPMRFPTQLTSGEDPTTLVATSPDGKYIVLARDHSGEENPGLYIQGSTGGPLEVIQHAPGIQTVLQRISDDGRHIYYRANDRQRDAYAIYRHDVAARSNELLISEPGLWSLADARPDGRLLLRKETGALTAEVYEWDPKTRQMTPLFGQGEKEEYEVAYGAAEGEIVVQTNKLGEFRRLYVWAKGKLAPITPEMKHDVRSFGIDRGRKRIVYTINEDGFTRLRAIDARTLKPLKLPKLPDSDHLIPGATTPDGRYTTVQVDDGRHPVRIEVIDWKLGRLQRWASPSTPEVDTTSFVRATLDAYPARDGARIPVLVRRSERCAREGCPVVIAFHGGPEGQSVPGFNVRAQAFVEAGFVYLEPNVRGSDGYGKAWLTADDGPKRLQVITDIEDAARWARARFATAGTAPAIGINGGSYGGYSTLVGMTMFAGAYDAGVEVVGMSNLVTFLRNTAPYRRQLRVSEYGDPDRDREALEKLSPINYVDRVHAPLLLLQGANDPRVPVGEAVQIYDRLQEKGVPSALMILPDEGHGAIKRENRALLLGHTIAFFEKHLARK